MYVFISSTWEEKEASYLDCVCFVIMWNNNVNKLQYRVPVDTRLHLIADYKKLVTKKKKRKPTTIQYLFGANIQLVSDNFSIN